jgi:SHS2 domain-containing protein
MSSNHKTDSEHPANYSIIDHTADWALRIQAHDIKELLITAALGMNDLLADDISVISLEINKRIEITAIDKESLLVEWLSELAYWAEMESIIFCKFIVDSISETHISANAIGGQVKELQKHIKAVTYHDLKIIKTDKGIEATVVFDV